jgi:hypothetical protein
MEHGRDSFVARLCISIASRSTPAVAARRGARALFARPRGSLGSTMRAIPYDRWLKSRVFRSAQRLPDTSCHPQPCLTPSQRSVAHSRQHSSATSETVHTHHAMLAEAHEYCLKEFSCSSSCVSCSRSNSRPGWSSDGISAFASCASCGHRLPSCASSKGSIGNFSRSLRRKESDAARVSSEGNISRLFHHPLGGARVLYARARLITVAAAKLAAGCCTCAYPRTCRTTASSRNCLTVFTYW